MRKIISKKSILWIATVSWMILIFMLSSQEATESDGLSLGLVGAIFKFISKFDGIPAIYTIDSKYLIQIASIMNFFVRKTAHFMLYAILAVLMYNLASCYITKRINAVCISSLICLLYAVSDEIHQVYVPGRAGQIKDVLIDFSGSALALGTIYLLFGRRVKYKI